MTGVRPRPVGERAHEGRTVPFGFAPETRADSASRLNRVLGPDEWAATAVPLLPNPRETVKELCARHLPSPGTVVVAVFGVAISSPFCALVSACAPSPGGGAISDCT